MLRIMSLIVQVRTIFDKQNTDELKRSPKRSSFNSPEFGRLCSQFLTLNALARFGIRFLVSMYLRKHWLKRIHKGTRQISGMTMFLYHIDFAHI